jgi:hypothetical protein
MKIAFVRACATGKQVRLAELEAAYKADDFSVFRRDIGILQQINVEHRKAHKDFWCPLEIGPRLSFEQEWGQQRQQRVDNAALNAALTASERSALTAVKKSSGVNTPKSKKRRLFQ